MKNAAAMAVSAIMITSLLAKERTFALALQRWEGQRTIPNLLHLVTSGFFLAEDVAALG